MSPPSTRVVAAILACFAVLLAAIVVGLYLTNQRESSPHPAADDEFLGHVHGLGVDPASNQLYVASHAGVFRVDDGAAQRVADRWQDTMGFAVIGPEHFLASGHPDLREDLPAHLGLIESTDGAETWQPLSLQGEADLHAIEPADTVIYAYDAIKGQLIASQDHRSWRVLATRPIADLAIRTTAAGPELYATTPRGDLLRYDTETGAATEIDAPALMLIDGQGGHLVGVGPDGEVLTSSDGTTWQAVGAMSGPPQALDAAQGQWHVATETGLFRSSDEGRTWQLVLELWH